MKKRVLKDWVENLLYLVNVMIVAFIAMINDFDNIITAVVLVIILLVIVSVNGYILSKYGREEE